jgi:hypothetical protein
MADFGNGDGRDDHELAMILSSACAHRGDDRLQEGFDGSRTVLRDG